MRQKVFQFRKGQIFYKVAQNEIKADKWQKQNKINLFTSNQKNNHKVLSLSTQTVNMLKCLVFTNACEDEK